MKNYDTVSEALSDLQRRGFAHNFNLKTDCIECIENNIRLRPEEFEIVETYRFEGNTDPADEAIVYAIQSDRYDLKGVLVNAYGIYADNVSAELIAKLHKAG